MIGRDKIQVVADFRERSSGVIEALRKKGDIAVSEGSLKTGDYLINGSITVERKTCRDFCISIIDGRLFRQVARLKKEAPRPVLVIEGGNLLHTGIDIDENAVRGALVSVSICWYMPVIFSRDPKGTADFIEMAGRQDLVFEKELWLRPGSKPKRDRRRQLYILQGLPEVGPKKALALLDHFGSIEKVVSASKEDLVSVPFIGDKTATAIRTIVKEASYLYKIKEGL